MLSKALEDIEKILNDRFSSYIKHVTKKYPNIDEDELITIWRGDKKIERDCSRTTTTSLAQGKCNYTFIKGDRKGEKCEKKCKDRYYCSSHEDSSNKEPKTRKIIPEVKKSVSPQPAERKSSFTLVLKRNKDLENKLWDSETGFVFEIQEDNKKVVVGKAKDKKILPLTPEDIKLCKELKFHFKPITKEDTKEGADKKIRKEKESTNTKEDTDKKTKKEKEDTKKKEVSKKKEEVDKKTKKEEVSKKKVVVEEEEEEEEDDEEVPKKVEENKKKEEVDKKTKKEEVSKKKVVVEEDEEVEKEEKENEKENEEEEEEVPKKKKEIEDQEEEEEIEDEEEEEEDKILLKGNSNKIQKQILKSTGIYDEDEEEEVEEEEDD